MASEYHKIYNLTHSSAISKNKKKYYSEKKENILAQKRKYYASNKIKIRAKENKRRRSNKDIARSHNLKANYGITLQDYNQLFIQQNGNCAICGINQSQLQEKLNVDHSHNTHKIRGLLCRNCNTGLGNFKDSISSLMNAVKYLSK